MKQIIKGDKCEVTALQRFFAGSIGGLCAQTTIYPLEVSALLIRLLKKLRNIYA